MLHFSLLQQYEYNNLLFLILRRPVEKVRGHAAVPEL